MRPKVARITLRPVSARAEGLPRVFPSALPYRDVRGDPSPEKLSAAALIPGKLYLNC
jgi:hypothetical protein